MKILIFPLLLISLFFSCTSEEDKTSEKADFCDCEMLAHDNLYNHFYLENRKEPYTGVCKLFYENGQLKQERKLVDGKNNGFFRNYSESGILIEEGSFLNNRHHGTFKYYDNQGKLTVEVKYENGVLISEKSAQ